MSANLSVNDAKTSNPAGAVTKIREVRKPPAGTPIEDSE